MKELQRLNPAATRKDIDIVFIQPDCLQIRYLSKDKNGLITSGEDCYKLYDFLESGRKKSFYQNETDKDLYDFCVMHDLISNVGDGFDESHDEMFRCFTPVELEDGIYAIRIDMKVFVFSADDPETIMKKSEAIFRSCVSEQDRHIFMMMLTDPSRVSISESKVSFDKKILLDHPFINCCVDKLNAYFSINIVSDHVASVTPDGLYFHRKLSTFSDPYWGSIIHEAIESQLVMSLHTGAIDIYRSQKSHTQYGCRCAPIATSLNAEKLQFCYGTGNTEAAAAGKACMEAIERYYAQAPLPSKIKASRQELLKMNIKHVDPDLFMHRAYHEGDVDSITIHWVQAHDIYDVPHLFPQAVCQYGSLHSDEIEIFAGLNNSSGCAAHTNFESAVKSGIAECIERDAMMMHWYNRVAPPWISLELLNDDIKEFINGPIGHEYEIKVLDITLDTLPVVLVAARNRHNEKPYFVCGASCASTYNEAIEKAALEFMVIMQGHKSMKFPPSVTLEEIRYPADHGIYYLDPSNSSHLDFLFEGTECTILQDNDGGLSLDDLCQKIGPVFVVDLKKDQTPSIPSICAVRVVVPNLVPISFGYQLDPFYHNRLYNFSEVSGKDGYVYNVEKLLSNYVPHFFT